MKNISGYLYIAMTVLLTVYGQLIIRWQVGLAGPPPDQPLAKILFLLRLAVTPWVLSGLLAAFLASMFWIATLTRFPLSYAYPCVASTFVLVVGGGGLLFGEPVRLPTIIGVGLIVIGIVFASQS